MLFNVDSFHRRINDIRYDITACYKKPFNSGITTSEGLYAYAVLTADTMMTDKMSWGKKPPAYDLYIAPWLAGTAFLSVTSMGGATSMTAMILMRSPGRKGMTQAAREAARVILVWAMNHVVPIM